MKPTDATAIPADRASLVSIIIDNHNYARFLPAAIDSALSQTDPRAAARLGRCSDTRSARA